MLGSMRKKRAGTARTEGMAGAKGAEDGVDMDAGIVLVDDSPPEQTIATSEILRTGDRLSGAQPGKVFILDLGPIFKLLGVKPKDRPGHNLGRFAIIFWPAASPALAPMKRKGRTFSYFA